jgi:hypothetical protein
MRPVAAGCDHQTDAVVRQSLGQRRRLASPRGRGKLKRPEPFLYGARQFRPRGRHPATPGTRVHDDANIQADPLNRPIRALPNEFGKARSMDLGSYAAS